jgi:hypothetical protein
VGPLQGALIPAALVAALVAPLAALACDVPDEGNMPWRRAIAKVKYLPETEAMVQMQPDRSHMRYVLSMDQPRHFAGRCWWPVEVRVDGRVWKRFLVTPQGDALREDRSSAGN